jgi:hypothetical protein
MILTTWCVFSAIVLFLSLTAHFATFLGIDPMEQIPGVMLIHVLIFPPFGAAIFYSSKIKTGRAGQNVAMAAAPKRLRVLTGVFFVYAFINFFILFFFLSLRGMPQHRDGKYFLQDHGKVVREVDEKEFHKRQAYVVRGFSGHWMLFSCAAITMLIGARNIRAQRDTIAA